MTKKRIEVLISKGDCTKEDRKKLIQLAKSAGYKKFGNRKKGSARVVRFYQDGDYQWCPDFTSSTALTMPQDWILIQEALGIEVVVEYVECIECDQFRNTIKGNNGVVFIIDHSNNEESDIKQYLKTFPESFKPSTLEAYKAQEAKKSTKVGELHFELSVDWPVSQSIAVLAGQAAINAVNTKKIKELEISTNELKVEIETKDKRIAELEGNLIIIGDVANKVLS